MTRDQKTLLERLVFTAQDVVRHATDSYILYNLAAAIARLDDIQSECYQFVSDIQPSPSTSTESREESSNG